MVVRSNPRAEAGFALPLALTGSLVLLLSGLSMQSLVLHGRQVQLAERRRLQSEDRLASAAQRVAADLAGPYACLKQLPLEQWRPEALPSSCPAGLDPQWLVAMEIDGQTVRLASWLPAQGGGLLQLQLAGEGPERRFRLDATGVKEVG